MKTIDAGLLARMFLAGANNLEAKKEWINELNVFPVPDGDTGTNMTLTIMSAAGEVSALDENADMEVICKAISSGSLRGARGNSGVILSQLLRGFTRSVSKKKELNAVDIAAGLQKAVETAYKAVMKPKEGTILTVAREAAEKAVAIAEDADDLLPFFREVFAHAELTLEKTPEMLPVLKEAGVVDSGGQGLLEVMRGAMDGYEGKKTDFTIKPAAKPVVTRVSAETEAEITFGYCTEFIVLLEKELTDEQVAEFKSFLMSIGDSVVMVADEEICKVHVHTNHPGQAFEKGLTYGQLNRMKVDNMRIEHQEKLIKDAERVAKEQAEADARAAEEAKAAKAMEERKPYGFISVSSGAGLSDIFRELGADKIIEGGQTMNPSTEDMLNAIDEVNADTIFIFPNNKNIVLAAQQARDLTEDKQIVVVPTKTVPQGITAMISFVPEHSPEENAEAMSEAASLVKTGQVTYAVRDTRIDDNEIHMGDIMGIGDSGIMAVGAIKHEVARAMVEKMVDEDSEVISIYYGKEIESEAASALAQELQEAYPDLEVELNEGGQPVYYYIISVE